MRWTTSIACCRAPDDVVGGDVRMHELARHVRRAVEAMTRGASGRGRVHGLSDFVPVSADATRILHHISNMVGVTTTSSHHARR
jgi:hypothetical protein